MYDDIIIIFLTNGKADEKYNEHVRKNWKYRFLNILIGILDINLEALRYAIQNCIEVLGFVAA